MGLVVNAVCGAAPPPALQAVVDPVADAYAGTALLALGMQVGALPLPNNARPVMGANYLTKRGLGMRVGRGGRYRAGLIRRWRARGCPRCGRTRRRWAR